MQSDMNKTLFTTIVFSITTSAMQQLGKLVDPAQGKTAINLDAAQMSIDMLTMLQVKTKGNLDKEEEALLRNSLSSLQMNYIETAKDLEKAAEAAPAPAPEKAPPEKT